MLDFVARTTFFPEVPSRKRGRKQWTSLPPGAMYINPAQIWVLENRALRECFPREMNDFRSLRRDPHPTGIVRLVVMSPPVWVSAAVMLKDAMVLTVVVRKRGIV